MPSHFHGTPAEEQALSAFINLIRAAETLSARVHQHLGAQGLTDSQFAVLEALFHLGPMCQRALADKLLKSGGNITLVIDNLEKQQLVERRRNPEDRRYITVVLTARGESLMAELFPRHAAILTELMDVLNPAEQQELRRLCRILGKQQRDLAQPADAETAGAPA
ncbi:MAG TPA: MarR family transcriptional regulator [Candidatus Obscuribacterales bacterium]